LSNWSQSRPEIPFVTTWFARSGYDNWQAADLEAPASNEVLGWHPDGYQREYSMAKIYADAVDLMNVIGPDPVSGLDQTLELLCCCQIPGSYQIRGKMGGLLRVGTGVATGTKLSSNRYMVVGDFAIDGWNSADALQS
jgi:hypothetical protein